MTFTWLKEWQFKPKRINSWAWTCCASQKCETEASILLKIGNAKNTGLNSPDKRMR